MLKKYAFALAFSAFALPSVQAFALDEVYSPNVVKGEFEVEYSGSRTFDSDHAKDNIQGHEIELEYGLTDHLKIKTSGVFENDADENTRLSDVEVGGIYQFFESGEKWLDVGLLLVYGQSVHTDEDPNAIEAKLLLEKQTGAFVHRANLGLEQEVGHLASGGPERSFLWSSRYRYDEHFEPGFEIQSSFGKTGEHLSFQEQEHYAGPAVYGQLLEGVKYEVAYEFGLSQAAADGAARAKLEYEMHF